MKGYATKATGVIDYVAHDSEVKGFNDQGLLELDTKIVAYVSDQTHNEIEIGTFPAQFYPRRFMVTEAGDIVENPLWIKPESAELKELQQIVDLLLLDSLGV